MAAIICYAHSIAPTNFKLSDWLEIALISQKKNIGKKPRGIPDLQTVYLSLPPAFPKKESITT